MEAAFQPPSERVTGVKCPKYFIFSTEHPNRCLQFLSPIPLFQKKKFRPFSGSTSCSSALLLKHDRGRRSTKRLRERPSLESSSPPKRVSLPPDSVPCLLRPFLEGHLQTQQPVPVPITLAAHAVAEDLLSLLVLVLPTAEGSQPVPVPAAYTSPHLDPAITLLKPLLKPVLLRGEPPMILAVLLSPGSDCLSSVPSASTTTLPQAFDSLDTEVKSSLSCPGHYISYQSCWDHGLFINGSRLISMAILALWSLPLQPGPPLNILGHSHEGCTRDTRTESTIPWYQDWFQAASPPQLMDQPPSRMREAHPI